MAEYWAREMEEKMYKQDVFRAIANTRLENVLKKGDTVNRAYRSNLEVVNYTRGTAFTVQYPADTNEQLTVQTAKILPFYVNDLDEIQNNYGAIKNYAMDSAKYLGNEIDGDVLGEYDQADWKVGAYEIAATGSASDGIGFTLTTSNVQKMFAVAQKKLAKANVFKDHFAVISPEVQQVLLEYLAGKESMLGDSTGVNGHIGKYYGFDLYLSNALGWSAVLAAATLMTDTDTIVINGVTFTADADGAAEGAGHFSIQGSATLCNAQLAEAINNTQAYAASVGTVDTYIEITAANRVLMHGITATGAATTVTLKGEGIGTVAVSETLTTTANTWTTTTQLQHNLFGQRGASDIVIQKKPHVEVKDIYNDLGKNVACWTLYGLKTFDDGDVKLVDVQVRSDGF